MYREIRTSSSWPQWPGLVIDRLETQFQLLSLPKDQYQEDCWNVFQFLHKTGSRKTRTFEETIAQLGSGALLLGPKYVGTCSSSDAFSAAVRSLSSSSAVRSMGVWRSGLEAVQEHYSVYPSYMML